MPRSKPSEPFPRRTIIVLVVMNLLPLFGVVLLEWGARPLMLLYWAEGLLVTLFCALKVVLLSNGSDGDDGGSRVVTALLMVLSYVAFWYVHGLAIATLLPIPAEAMAEGETFSPFPWGAFGMLGRYTGLLWWVCLGGLAFSQCISLLVHFFGRSERRYLTADKLLFRPYRRTILFQLVVLTIALLARAFGQPLALVFVLVFAKIAADLPFHIKMHRERMRRRVRGGKQSISFVN